MEQESNQALLAALAQDLPGNYIQVVQQYQHRLYAFALRLCGSAEDAEDIVQEALVGAYVSLENYSASRILSLKLRAWLFQVTFNVYQHHTRGSRLHLVPLTLTDDSPTLEIADREEEQPEALFEQQEQRAELIKLLACLPEHYRVALTCYYFEHLNYQELAELLDQPVGTVKSTVSRGIRLLRATLAEQPVEQIERKQLWSKMSLSRKV
ncbi:MAG TPA: RNA polymerase sigma factor [Ktedonobacteraceae bacterium]|jgi:RNA polymerase sigma-70 factor (ECF subfamily)